METTLGETFVDIFIPLSAALGIAFALYQWGVVSRVKLTAPLSVYGLEDGQSDNVDQQIAEIQHAISTGATSFLTTEYKYLAVFMAFFSVLVFLFLGSVNSFSTSWQPCTGNPSQLCAPSLANAFFTTVAFILGALTSTLSGYLGMKIATYANARTTVEARRGIGPAFVVAFRSGAVMGFLLAANGLIVLFITIVLFRLYYGNDWASLFETITGYGLGGSSVALFGRVGGGIYTKAADVGADLVGKVERGIPEDDPRNPAVIADNVGDNTHNFTAMCFPLLVSALGILVCLFTTLFATDWFHVTEARHVEPQLKAQLLISTVLMTPLVLGLCYLALPASFTIVVAGEEADKTAQNWQIFFFPAMRVTFPIFPPLSPPSPPPPIPYPLPRPTLPSPIFHPPPPSPPRPILPPNPNSPVRDVADSCRTGAATNIIFGLALGYKSVVVPVFAIAVAIYISYAIAAMYGVALAALGMLSTLATSLAIDAYGPISDNAGGIAEMAGLGADVRERTDALDSAGNTTAAIGKGFAIGSAALVSLALFGAYVSRAQVTNILITNPQTFVGLLVGAMLPYWFSAMTMKSVGKAALAMVNEVRRQFDTIPGLMEGTARPDYHKCVQISTKASLNEMLPPGALVLLAPIITGVLFGTATLAGLLAGALVSGVQMAVSASNTGGAWDNAKKYIEAGMSEHAQSLGPKGSEAHKAAVIGDTVGDPLKDTSGPSLNILIKLMAVESLVLAPFFVAHGGLIWGKSK
ncbi:unnamed protein product [Closterium sp. Naga37s-1]|nr:unnamed protein product [Closterium sp. Naga37s-1]